MFHSKPCYYNTNMHISDQTRAFIHRHEGTDVRELALHTKPSDQLDLPFALDQIAGRTKARTKLPQWAQHEDVIYPPHLAMEQCSSQFTAAYKANLAQRLLSPMHCQSSTSLLDMTGGFGVDFSYMAPMFDEATYVERQEHLCEIARHNMRALGINNAHIICDNGVHVLNESSQYTMIYLDPARRDAHGARTYAIADCTPNVLELRKTLLTQSTLVMIKLSPMLDWRKTVADLNGAVHEVHIVSTNNECKELLLVLRQEMCDNPIITCVNDDDDVVSFHMNDNFDGALAPCTSWHYLYEPNASIMKAGCFSYLEHLYTVHQISVNSHLFVSERPIEHFPGRSFVIERMGTMNKRIRKTLCADISRANIAVRNFPLSVAQLRAKLKIADGGDTYVFATTAANGNHMLIVTKKMG